MVLVSSVILCGISQAFNWYREQKDNRGSQAAAPGPQGRGGENGRGAPPAGVPARQQGDGISGGNEYMKKVWAAGGAV